MACAREIRRVVGETAVDRDRPISDRQATDYSPEAGGGDVNASNG
jgi:hypothetical protein